MPKLRFSFAFKWFLLFWVTAHACATVSPPPDETKIRQPMPWTHRPGSCAYRAVRRIQGRCKGEASHVRHWYF